jgi:hypothetical protein
VNQTDRPSDPNAVTGQLPASPHAPTAQPGPSSADTPAAGGWKRAARAVAADAVPPLALFYLLHALGVPDMVAYLAGALIPLGRLVIDRVRGRSFNVISALVGVFLIVSVALALLTHDVRVAMARGGVIYFALAVVFGISLLTRRPMMLLISRYFAAKASPAALAGYDHLYASAPRFRKATRVVTGVWAIGFGLTAVACVTCAYTLPITAAAAVNGMLEPVVAIALAAWSTRYLRPRPADAIS